MMYDLHITSAAENDLNEAADYIEYVLLNPDAADRLLDAATERISTLAQFAERNALVDDPVLKAWGIRFIQVNNYLAFYVISEEESRVYIVRFLYGKRNWIGILKQGLSITHLEVLKAIEHNIPVYTFIDKRIWHDHELYEKNKTKEIINQITFPSIEKQETAKYIFNFINFIRLRAKGNNIFPFEKGQDIEETLGSCKLALIVANSGFKLMHLRRVELVSCKSVSNRT